MADLFRNLAQGVINKKRNKYIPRKKIVSSMSLSPVTGNELVINGNFNTDTNWTKGAGVTISGGQANLGGGTAVGSPLLLQSNILTLDKWIYSQIQGSAAYYYHAHSHNQKSYSANSYVRALCALSNYSINVYSGNPTGYLDNASVKIFDETTIMSLVSGNAATSKVYANITYSSTASGFGLIINANSQINPQNFLIAYFDRMVSKLYVWKVLNNTYSLLGSVNFSYSAGAEARIVRTGNSFDIYYNGSKLLTISAGEVVTGKYFGVMALENSGAFLNVTGEW